MRRRHAGARTEDAGGGPYLDGTSPQVVEGWHGRPILGALALATFAAVIADVGTTRLAATVIATGWRAPLRSTEGVVLPK